MKFILNTSVRPHFCALFDDQDKLIDIQKWEEHRRDSEETFSFLKKNKADSLPISFVGGVSGPGGFSSLRVGAGILNALSFSKNIPIHSVRSDIWIRKFVGSDHFVLESFGEKVFVPENGKLTLTTIANAVEKFRDQPLFVKILPEDRQKQFPKIMELSLEGMEKVLLSVLQQQDPQNIFLPEYLFPAI